MSTQVIEVTHNVTEVEVTQPTSPILVEATQAPPIQVEHSIGGFQGAIGPPGEFGSLSIGDINISEDIASAEITGEPGNQFLHLTLLQGPQGTTGAIGPQGPPGNINSVNGLTAADITISMDSVLANQPMTSSSAMWSVPYVADDGFWVTGLLTVDSLDTSAITYFRSRSNHTGTQSADTLTDGTTNKAFLATERTKLTGIATGATANSSDATLLARANHTGTQTSATISDFNEAAQDAVATLLAQGTNVTLSYNDAGNTLTINSTGGGLDAEAVRDTIGIALVGVGVVTVTPNDALDTITISSTATQNSTDAALRDRSTHTGAQAISTVTGLQAALDLKAVDTAVVHLAGAETISGIKDFSGGIINLTNGTSNMIIANSNGLSAPTFTTRSAGTRFVLSPTLAGAAVDFAIGMETQTFWSSVSNSSQSFKWYAGTTQIASLTGAGAFTAASYAGSGAALTALNGSNIASGTIAQARIVPNIVRVVHGATAGTARPTGATYVEWVGSVEPTNAINDDTWVNTA